MLEFLKATRRVTDEIDQGARAAGRSAGGIYGKKAAQALTPDNHVAELYDPAAIRFETRRHNQRERLASSSKKLWQWLRRTLSAFLRRRA